MEKKINATEKFCTKCGKKFIPVGREVICPECKAQAAEESKRAAVMRAKKASWTGESVPVRISGRASTLIRKYGEANSLSFAESLDALLKASSFFTSLGVDWSTIQPYKSRRRDKAAADKAAAVFLHDKHATETAQEATGKPQDVQDAPQNKPQEVKQAAKASKTSTAKKAAGASKTAAKKGEKKA